MLFLKAFFVLFMICYIYNKSTRFLVLCANPIQIRHRSQLIFNLPLAWLWVRLTNLPCSYQPTEKLLFVALHEVCLNWQHRKKKCIVIWIYYLSNLSKFLFAKVVEIYCNLVIYFILAWTWILKILFSDSLIKFSRLFLKLR